MNLYEFVSIQEGLLIMGVLLLVVEVIFFGFATFFLLFIGISCLIAGLLMSFSIIPDTTLSALSSISIFVIIIAFGFWKPLKKLQKPDDNNEIEVGLVGHKFTLTSDVSPNKPIDYKYSGVNWIVKSLEEINAGHSVKVIKLEVGVLLVAKD